MPGPFPGMDPYLENSTFWPDLHAALIYGVRAELNRSLPEGFAASIDERLYVVQPGYVQRPDVAVLQRPGAPVAGMGVGSVVGTADRPFVFDVQAETVRETFIEILTTRGPERVVTVVEVLSPANKAAGSEGRAEYRRKQADVLRSDASLVEIDLLRSGEHTVAMTPGPLAGAAGRFDYVVCLHRSHTAGRYECWAVNVQERLPRIEVPLTDGHPDVVVDLQAILDRAYDDGPYRRRVDYGAEPVPPLRAEDAAWADALLKGKGLRP